MPPLASAFGGIFCRWPGQKKTSPGSVGLVFFDLENTLRLGLSLNRVIRAGWVDGYAQKVSHRIWTWAIPRRDAELAKCQILCTEHHKEKTRADRPIPEHGTISRYGSIHKCRCDLCRKANADRKKLNEAKKKARELEEFRTEYPHAA